MLVNLDATQLMGMQQPMQQVMGMQQPMMQQVMGMQ